MKLTIAEKPDVARAIVNALGGFSKQDGYYTNGADCVTYCFGHMLRLKEPDELDETYKYWRMNTLPIPPILPPQRVISHDKKRQVTIIADLLKKADTVIHAGDPDDEGQLLVDELLRFFNYQGTVLRLLINDNTPAVVQKALNNLKDNRQFEHLGYKAESRAIADQLYGYNLTRAYSLQAQSMGNKETLHIGRVQTPILGLVVRRDRAFFSHKESFYYVLNGLFSFNNISFHAKYNPKPTDPTDDKNRLIDKTFAQHLANTLQGKPATAQAITTTPKSKQPPLPYNLLKLQQDASRIYGLSADDTLQITQSLRETHQLITYNRSDCQYLSDEQFNDVPAVLSAIAQGLPYATDFVQKCNQTQKGRAFNSDKVSAHHAIIPTQTIANWQKLSTDEQNVYKLIARAYIAQFYPNYEYDETQITIAICHNGTDYEFTATFKVITQLGFKELYTKDDDEYDTPNLDIRSLPAQAQGICQNIDCSEQKTKPTPLYTESTLLGDLTRVAKYVQDPQLAQILKDKDKDKAGEHGGIGTPATRSSIIKGLFDRGYLAKKGKSIISTDKGQALYDKLDDNTRFPDLTAIWHKRAEDIKSGDDVATFINQMMVDISPTIEQIKQSYKEPSQNSPTAPCPVCQRPMRRLASKYKKGEFYWSCSGYNDSDKPCKHTMGDDNGTPVEKAKTDKPKQFTEFNCQKCGAPLVRYDGISKAGKPYIKFNCSAFPKCKQSYWADNDKPRYE